MKQIIQYLLLSAFLSATIYGCAWQSDVAALHDRLVFLEHQLMDVRKRNENALKGQEHISGKIDTYSRNREQREHEIISQSATLATTFDRFREDIQSLTGRVEENENMMKRAISQSEQLEQDLQNRISKMEQYLNFDSPVIVGASRVPSPTGTTTPETRAAEAPPSQRPPTVVKSASRTESMQDQAKTLFSSEDELYAVSKRAFDNGDYRSARDGFATLLKQYPNSRFADNCLFWIGDSYYRENDFRRAIAEYNKVIENFPNGNKVKDALLKQAFAFFNLGDKENAKLIYEELIHKYPSSSQAAIAKQKLEGMK